MSTILVIFSLINILLCVFVLYINYALCCENKKLLEDLLHAREMIGTIRGREIQAREQNAAIVSYLGEFIPYELRSTHVQ